MYVLSRAKILAILTVAFFIASSITSISKAQTLEEPQIVILTPNTISYDPAFEEEIQKETQVLRKQIESNPMRNVLDAPQFQNLPERRKQFFRNFKIFYDRLDFFKNIALISGNYLSYTFGETFASPLITMNDIRTSGTAAELKAIYDSIGLQYVVNFPSVRIYKDSGKIAAKIVVQLYDGQTGSIVFSKEYLGGWENHGFDFSCMDSTIQCTINNSLSQALADIVSTISFLSPTVRNEKKIEQERYLLLINRYYSAPYDKHLINSAISPADSTIDRKLLYQCLYDSSRTKFVGFYSAKMPKQDFLTMQKNKKDRSVNIKMDHAFTDGHFSDEVPQTYAYLVCGIRYRGKWYYKKPDATYFDPNDSLQGKLEYFNTALQRYHFFKAHSIELNPEFWETDLFAKVRDLRQDPQWETYGTGIWKNEERENRPYVGMYELVADNLREQRKASLAKADTLLFKTVFIPFYKKLHTVVFQANRTLIYPADRSIILNPVALIGDNGQCILRYFVYLPKEKKIYEWTYLPVAALDSNAWFATQIIDKLKSAVEWNYSYTTLDNADFWQNMVLPREGKNYKYLQLRF